MKNLDEILERIKELRKAKGLTQLDMSDKIGMAKNNYGKLENGHIELTVKRLYELADILQVSVVELLGERATSESSLELKAELERLKIELEIKEADLVKKTEFTDTITDAFAQAMKFLNRLGESSQNHVPAPEVEVFREGFKERFKDLSLKTEEEAKND